jgi:hypothetical protein
MLTPHRSRSGRISSPLLRREHDLLLQFRDDEETYQRPRRRPRRLKTCGFDEEIIAKQDYVFEQSEDPTSHVAARRHNETSLKEAAKSSDEAEITGIHSGRNTRNIMGTCHC